MLYPINLDLENKNCLVIGGGAVATRKILSLLKANAKITVISPTVTEKISALAKNNIIAWLEQPYESGMVNMANRYFLTIVATDDEKVNLLAIGDAKKTGSLVNAPANVEFSDFTVPATLRRGDLTVAISTEKISPAFSRILKEEIEEFLPKNIDKWLSVLKNIRSEMKATRTIKERESFWRSALNKRIFKLLREDKLEEAEVELRNDSGNGCKS